MSTLLLGTLLLIASPPDVAEGRRLFHDAGLGTTGIACAACHATVADEARDGDGRIRAGHSLAGVAKRRFWRGDRRRRSYRKLAEAVDVCVRIFQGQDPLEGRARRAMTAFLASISRRPHARGELDTGLMPDLDYARPQFQGGDADRGRGLFFAACHSCHPHGRSGLGPSIRGAKPADVARATREGNGLLRGARKPGAWMPAFGRERLADRDVADIAAYVSTLRPSE